MTSYRKALPHDLNVMRSTDDTDLDFVNGGSQTGGPVPGGRCLLLLLTGQLLQLGADQGGQGRALPLQLLGKGLLPLQRCG